MHYKSIMTRNSRNNDQENTRNIKNQCKQYKYYHVIGYLNDGNHVHGILVDYDDNHATILIPEDIEIEDGRQYGGYGRRYRRFRRRRFPFFVFAFPFFSPYPYYYPY